MMNYLIILGLLVLVAFFKSFRDWINFKFGKIAEGFWGIRSDSTNDAWHWSEKGRQACWAMALILAMITGPFMEDNLWIWIYGLMIIAFVIATFHFIFYHLVFKNI